MRQGMKGKKCKGLDSVGQGRKGKIGKGLGSVEVNDKDVDGEVADFDYIEDADVFAGLSFGKLLVRIWQRQNRGCQASRTH